MIFIPLILAHLLGDFLLQPNSWVADKEQKKGKSKFLYFHVLIHIALVFIFLWNIQLWWIALIIGITHFLIDWAILQFQTPKTKRTWFFVDQLLHIVVIVLLSVFYLVLLV